MKKLQSFREFDKRFKLKKYYIVTIAKTKKGDLFLPIPNDIIKAYHIQPRDIAIFEIINKNLFMVKFVKRTMYSFIEKLN